MYRWVIEKVYEDSIVSTGKDGFYTYNECLEDVLRHTNIDSAFRKAYAEEVITLTIKIEKYDD